MSIVYFDPFEHNNQFVEINKTVLFNMNYKVLKLYDMYSIKAAWKQRHGAAVVLNWAEDQMYRQDANVFKSFALFTKYIFTAFLSTIVCSKRIWIRHNFRPHNATGVLLYFPLLSIVFKVCKFKEVYLEDYVGQQHLLHPLYSSDEILLNELKTSRDFNDKSEFDVLFFGSIKTYKNVDILLQNWPLSLKLKIMGYCSELELENKLREIIADRCLCVVWQNEYVEDDVLEKELVNSDFVILPHGDDSMVSSGTFYHAITFGCCILASDSSFARKKAETHDFVNIARFDSITKEFLNSSYVPPAVIIKEALKYYGRANLRKKWQDLLK